MCLTKKYDLYGAVKDAQIVSTDAATNFGDGATMASGPIGDASSLSLIMIDPGPLPPMIQLLSAEMRLFVESTADTLLAAYWITSAWEEAEVTWDNFQVNGVPNYNEAAYVGLDIEAGATMAPIDMTDFAFALSTGTPNFGFAIDQQGPDPTIFATSEDPDGINWPEIRYCYIPDLCANVECAPPADPCHAEGVCDPTTGICTEPLQPNGAACDDGNDQTSNDACVDGVCLGQAAGGFTYELFANGPGFDCPTGATVWTSAAPRNPMASAHAMAACEACYGVGQCYGSDEDGAGLAWGPTGGDRPACDQAYFGYTVGNTGDEGRSWRMCASSTTFGYWGK